MGCWNFVGRFDGLVFRYFVALEMMEKMREVGVLKM